MVGCADVGDPLDSSEAFPGSRRRSGRTSASLAVVRMRGGRAGEVIIRVEPSCCHEEFILFFFLGFFFSSSFANVL